MNNANDVSDTQSEVSSTYTYLFFDKDTPHGFVNYCLLNNEHDDKPFFDKLKDIANHFLGENAQFLIDYFLTLKRNVFDVNEFLIENKYQLCFIFTLLDLYLNKKIYNFEILKRFILLSPYIYEYAIIFENLNETNKNNYINFFALNEIDELKSDISDILSTGTRYKSDNETEEYMNDDPNMENPPISIEKEYMINTFLDEQDNIILDESCTVDENINKMDNLNSIIKESNNDNIIVDEPKKPNLIIKKKKDKRNRKTDEEYWESFFKDGIKINLYKEDNELHKICNKTLLNQYKCYNGFAEMGKYIEENDIKSEKLYEDLFKNFIDKHKINNSLFSKDKNNSRFRIKCVRLYKLSEYVDVPYLVHLKIIKKITDMNEDLFNFILNKFKKCKIEFNYI